jgi:hypothetical protein
MKLGSTLQRAAPTDKGTSSLNVLDSIDQWRPLFERSALGVAMIDSGFHFLTANPAFLTMFVTRARNCSSYLSSTSA